jgi:hypothetical protein
LSSAPPDRFDLHRPRDLNALLSESVRLYRSHFWKFLAIGAVVVVPVYAAVFGIGLGQFKGGYDATTPAAAAPLPALVEALVVAPLVAAMALHAVREIAAGQSPGARRSIQAGLDAFTPVFWAVLLALLGEIAGVILIVLPFVLIFRWYLVPQVVVAESKRGTEALRASWQLTRGFGFRTAGLVIVARVLALLAGAFLATPIAILAKAVDSQALSLAATALAEALVAAPLGIFGALLYFDLRARQAGAAS